MENSWWTTGFTIVAGFIAIYMIVIIVFYTVILVISMLQLRKHFKLNRKQVYEDYVDDFAVKPISIIVPAFNEEAGIIPSVRSLLSVNYPSFEIIVVNDGSTDSTWQKMIEHYEMKEIKRVVRKQIETKPISSIYQSTLLTNLYLIDKENGGKADALNVGLNFAHYPYICSLDGDSVLEQDAFLKVMKPIVDSGEEVIASGGSVRIANGCEIHNGNILNIGLSNNPLVIMQIIEYLRAFLMGRIGLSRHNLLLIISGAFGVFSKKWIVEAGGYKTDTVGEDMEMVVGIHRLLKEKKLKKKIVYVPDPVCWTEVPEEMKFLRKQRRRWHRGLFESLWRHRKITFNPKYGSIGFISFPYFWIVEFLGPIVELFGYVFVVLSMFFGGIYLEFAILIFLLSCLYGSLFSMSAVLLEEWTLTRYPKVSDMLKLFFYSMTETIWYRPLTVFWRCEGIWQMIKGDHSWGEMKRKGVSR
ncbi:MULTISPECIES: glycosyltransferase [unclassified Bacillus (in: firmicutes)]|uniref:glycosyltransferase family 2 protein n=1 Tax=unclassified Bacillus (in: firmicutes) TaxID=185979 RepID=UPI0008EF08AC|nr:MULTISPECIES: glycosyltransferase [unclassified Bacillus (in: firmicutes)]SFA81066.1 Glycosyltransferase, catalytic subunit of cellulose synthase and poly-beta-1,6-N-acetylglucosamine synthase [Bacillus sp. UNCCL13]SFQ71200.1 Glycosyltransferase, catalytic subunit of cellulose synthase and poly-beta-1,6-N-acetylglucosamine synthase [Bacillus sp. cl95]